MPNVILTHTFEKSISDIKTPIDRSLLLRNAWIYIKQGFNKKEAFKKSWEQINKISVTFWTNAKPEDIAWTIKSCQKDGVVRKELLRKWDSDMIVHSLDWVSYHLRRNGFEITEVFNTKTYSVSHEIPKL